MRHALNTYNSRVRMFLYMLCVDTNNNNNNNNNDNNNNKGSGSHATTSSQQHQKISSSNILQRILACFSIKYIMLYIEYNYERGTCNINVDIRPQSRR